MSFSFSGFIFQIDISLVFDISEKKRKNSITFVKLWKKFNLSFLVNQNSVHHLKKFKATHKRLLRFLVLVELVISLQIENLQKNKFPFNIVFISVDIKFENFVNILKINSNFVNICPSEFSNLTLLSRQQQAFRKFELLQFKHVENKWMNENKKNLRVFLMSRFFWCLIMSSAKQKIFFWKEIKDVGSNNYHKYYLVSTIQRLYLNLNY